MPVSLWPGFVQIVVPTGTASTITFSTTANQTSITTTGNIYYNNTSYTSSAEAAYQAGIAQALANQQQQAAMQNAIHCQAQQVDIRRIERAQERILQRRTADMARHANDVQQRARELLLRNLTPEQRESFLANKFFVVEGGLTKKRYRIEDLGHMVANIRVIEERGGRLCGHCAHAIPMGDQLLAQKLMLEADEEAFLRLANKHP